MKFISPFKSDKLSNSNSFVKQSSESSDKDLNSLKIKALKGIPKKDLKKHQGSINLNEDIFQKRSFNKYTPSKSRANNNYVFSTNQTGKSP